MSRNSFNININLKGFPKANQQLGETKKGLESMRTATSGLRRQIGALRNNILLFTFTVGGAAVVVNRFVSAASRFQDVRTRLVGLTGGIDQANEAFERFNAVAVKTPFALGDVVNAGAQLEAFGVNSKAVLASLTDLAAFMNTTATEAASALGRAFAGGAGAADVLRDRGILQLIKDAKGIEDLTKLTLPEFRVALLEALTDPDGRISGSADRLSKTFSGALSNMQGSVEILSATIGDMFLPQLTDTIIAVDKLIQGIDEKEIKEFAVAITLATTGLVIYRSKMILAALANLKFAKSFRAMKITAFVLALGFVIDKILEYAGVFDDATEATKDLNEEVENAKKDQDAYIESLKNSVVAVEELNDADIKYTNTLQKKVDRLVVELATLEGADARTIAFLQTKKSLTAQDLKLIDRAEELTKAIEEEKLIIREAEEATKRLNDIRQQTINIDGQIIANKRLIAILESALTENTLSSLEAADSNIKKEQLRLQTLEDLRTELGIHPNIMKNLVDSFDLMSAGATENANVIKLNAKDTLTLSEQEAALAVKIIENAQATQLYTDAIKKQSDATKQLTSDKEALENIENGFLSLFSKTEEGQRRSIESTIEAIEKNKEHLMTLENIGEVEIGHVIDQLNLDLENLSNSTNELGKQGALAAGIILNLAGSFKQLTDAQTDTDQQTRIMLRSLGQILMLFPGGQLPGALLQAGSMFVAHTGGLIKDDGIQRFATGGLVKDVPIQKFATGGVIQGQDNVPILAQAGEFVMRRSAVQNIGVQNLADMNRTGSVGGVTVNIQGNMIGNDEFVRDNLIPQLQKASKQELA